MKISWSIKLGIIAGILNCIAWYLYARSMNYYSFEVDRYRYYTTLLCLLAGIFSSIYLEKRSNGGFIEYKNAAKSGILFTLVLSISLAIFNYVYYSVLVPDLVDYFLSEEKKAMLDLKLDGEIIAKNQEMLRSYFGSFRMFMSTLIIGVIISLVAAAVLRKKNPVAVFSEN
ncbi:MAG: DUF4199 domain-containing protein [Bacteroidota bacterium]|nr:DUF4199 domain-containing protein [Bacteroidota bacterium]